MRTNVRQNTLGPQVVRKSNPLQIKIGDQTGSRSLIPQESPRQPQQLIQDSFSPDTIRGVQYAAIAVSFIILFQVVIRLALLIRPSYNPYKKVSEEGTVESGDEENNDDDVKV